MASWLACGIVLAIVSPHSRSPAFILQAHARGLTRPGDRVVVSQCPRKTSKFDSVMSEAGVVKIITLGADGVGTVVATAVLDSAGHVVGSRDEDESDLV